VKGSTSNPAAAGHRRRSPDFEGLRDAFIVNVRSFSITGQVIWALILRNFRAEYGHRRLGLLWAFIPPLVTVAFLVLILSSVRHDMAPIGHDVAPFLALGLLNLNFFQGTMRGVAASINGGKSLLVFPRVKVLDLYLARFLLEVAILTVVFTVFMSAFVLFDLIPPPEELDRVLLPLFIGSMIGLGGGLMHAVLLRLTPAWDLVWKVVSRVLFLSSGLFFIADGMPIKIQALLYYNPILHLCEWVRSGYYADYESRFLDPTYPVGFMLVVLLLGFCCERVFRRTVLEYRRRG
jgi:capsular polysaccharide transport system permease protein